MTEKPEEVWIHNGKVVDVMKADTCTLYRRADLPRHDELTDDEVEGLKLSSAFFVTVAEQQAYNQAIDYLRKRGMIRRGR